MKKEAAVTFYYNDDVSYESSIKIADEGIIENNRRIVTLEDSSPNRSFAYTSVDIYTFGKLSYWFKFSKTQYYSKGNGKLKVQFEKELNSISFILDD